MVLRSLLESLFPRRCAGCGDAGPPFCPPCLASVAVLSPPGCRRCGRPRDLDVETCPDCPPAAISWARAPFLYAGAARSALFRLKFGGIRDVARELAPWMASVLSGGLDRGGETLAGEEPPCLTWVPLGRRRRRERGYDQAEALAACVSALTRHPARRLLQRVVDTAPQARRSGSARRIAIAGAFSPLGRAPPVVVLVDDVLTSGVTAAECASVLRGAGAREVGVLTAARSLGGRVPVRCYNPAGLQPGSVVARETFFR